MEKDIFSRFTDLREKYGAFFIDPESIPFRYDDEAIRRLVDTRDDLIAAVDRRSEEKVLILPAPAKSMGISEIFRNCPECFSSPPTEWSSRETKITMIDPHLEGDHTAPGVWYLFRIPRESYGMPADEQLTLGNPISETVVGLATLLWTCVAFASARNGIPLFRSGKSVRTLIRSSDSGQMVVLSSGGKLVVSDCYGPEGDIGMSFLQSISLPSA